MLAFQRARRDECEDEYPLLHFGSSFCIATIFRLKEADESADVDVFTETLLRQCREMKTLVEAAGGCSVYVGRVAWYGVLSKQADVAYSDWHGAFLHRWPSLAAYRAALARHPGLAAALSHQGPGALFGRVYSSGMQTSPAISALSSAQPAVFLSLVRLIALLLGKPNALPLQRMPEERVDLIRKSGRNEASRIMDEVATDIEKFGLEEGKRVCILNYIQKGASKAQKSDGSYVRRMMEMFAEANAGPLHLGRAVHVDESTTAAWHELALVSYPSKAFFSDLVCSTFMMGSGADVEGGEGIGAQKAPGDSIALATIPILSRL